MYYRGTLTTFTTDSDTFRTIAAFPRKGGILSEPSPNPFRPSVDGQMWISVSVPGAAGILTPQGNDGPQSAAANDAPAPVGVTIKVYDVLGRLVKDLYNDRVYVTVVSQPWNGTSQRGDPVPSGMYFIKAKAGSSTGTKKVLVIR
jgi:flagellar hook assembly protein FlgD